VKTKKKQQKRQIDTEERCAKETIVNLLHNNMLNDPTTPPVTPRRPSATPAVSSPPRTSVHYPPKQDEMEEGESEAMHPDNPISHSHNPMSSHPFHTEEDQTQHSHCHTLPTVHPMSNDGSTATVMFGFTRRQIASTIAATITIISLIVANLGMTIRGDSKSTTSAYSNSLTNITGSALLGDVCRVMVDLLNISTNTPIPSKELC